MLYANSQEFGMFEKLIAGLQKQPDLFTDFAIQGLERNKSFERKDLKDALASIIDGRIFDQLKELSKHADEYEPFIIIEGFGFYNHDTKQWMNLSDYFALYPDRELAFYKTEAAFRAFGVGLVWTVDQKGTARYLTRENEVLGKPKEKKEFPERGGFKKDWPLEKQRLYMMEAFGHETAKAFLDEYGSVGTFFLREKPHDNEKNDVVRVLAQLKTKSGRRIPEKTAEKIYDVIV